MRILLICLLLLLPLSISADLITIDPNTGGNQLLSDIPGPLSADTRLDQKITYQARHKQVRLILDDLSIQTGVTLKAGYNNMDWQVRDRRMTISVKDLSLRELMQSIARVMVFKWSVSESGGVPYYRLYMDRRALLGAQNKNKREMEVFQNEMERRRCEFTDGLLNLPSLSLEELAALNDTNPQLHRFVSSYAGQKVGDLLRALPQAIDALRSGDAVTVNAKDMPPAAQELVSDIVEGYIEGKEGFYGSTFYLDMLKKDTQDKTLKTTIKINENYDKNQASPEFGAILAIIRIECGAFSLYDAHLTVEGASDSRPRSYYPFGDSVVVHDADPELERKIKFVITPPNIQNHSLKLFKLPDCILSLAEASGYSVVADSLYIQMRDPQVGERSIRSVLDSLTSEYRCNWWRRGDLIEVRSRDWFSLRSRQIPDEWLDRWFTSLEKEGCLDIDYMAHITSLTREQHFNNVYQDERIPGCPHCYLASCWTTGDETLCFYWTLSKDQRRMLFTDEGLDIGKLDPHQWSCFEKIFAARRTKHPEYLQNRDAKLRLMCVKNDKDPKKNSWDGITVTYDFTLTTSDDLPPLEWKVYSVKYYQKAEL